MAARFMRDVGIENHKKWLRYGRCPTCYARPLKPCYNLRSYPRYLSYRATPCKERVRETGVVEPYVDPADFISCPSKHPIFKLSCLLEVHCFKDSSCIGALKGDYRLLEHWFDKVSVCPVHPAGSVVPPYSGSEVLAGRPLCKGPGLSAVLRGRTSRTVW